MQIVFSDNTNGNVYTIEDDGYEYYLTENGKIIRQDSDLVKCVGDLSNNFIALKKAILNYQFMVERLAYLIYNKGYKKKDIPSLTLAPSEMITLEDWAENLKTANEELMKL